MFAKLRGAVGNLWSKYKQLSVPVKASLWFIGCSVVQKGMAFFTTPIFTRLMSTEQYGQFTLYTSWFNIISIFVTLNLQYGTFNTAQVKFSNDRKAYTSSVQGLVTVISLLALGIFAIFGNLFESIMELPVVLLLLMLLHIWGQFAINLWMSGKRFDYGYKSMIALTLFQTAAGMGVGLLFVANSTERGYARILATILVEVAFGVGLFIYNMVRGKKFFVKEYWKFGLGFNVPLIPYYLSQVVFSQSDRIMISKIEGNDKAGIYGLAHNNAFLLSFIISAIRNAFIPKFFQNIKANDSNAAKRDISKLILVVAALLFLFIFVAPELLWIMGGEAYMEAIWIIPPLVAGLLFEYFTDFSVNILFFHEKKWMLVLSTIGCAVVNIILNYFGILLFGYQATAYATLVSYILFWLLLDYSARKICKKQGMDADGFLCSKQQLAIGGGFLVLSVGCLLLYRSIYLRYGVFLAALVVLFLLRKKLLPIIKDMLPFGK